MKESYHICFTSHDEVLFRDDEDHGAFINLMALRAYAWDTEILADAEMSTHVHLNVFTQDPAPFCSQLRMSYSRYFNHKYGRKGRFGQKSFYQLLVKGHNHQMVLENYILRNGLHHGAAPTALAYTYCSVRDMFAEDIGMTPEPVVSLSRAEMASFLPHYADFPDHYQMNAKGVFVRRSFMELRRAEQYYGSPRNYLYQMNRLTDETWAKEQLKDGTGAPLTLREIEQQDEASIADMLKNESGRTFSPSRRQDLDVCRLIDNTLAPAYGATSPYQLTADQKHRVARQLYYEYHVSEAQIRRCLVL